MPLIERDITLTCVSNEVGGPYVGGARWLGVPPRRRCSTGPASAPRSADQILSTDVDGMTISTPLDLATRRPRRDDRHRHERPAAAPRPRLPGADGRPRPLRLRQRLQVDHPHDAHDVRREDGVLDRPRLGRSTRRSRSRAGSTPPSRCRQTKAGKTFIGGVAWAQRRRHRRGGGPHRRRRVAARRSWVPSVNDDYWRQWYLEWDAEPGRHLIASRATNKNGDVQTAARATPFPEGASGVQSRHVARRRAPSRFRRLTDPSAPGRPEHLSTAGPPRSTSRLNRKAVS